MTHPASTPWLGRATLWMCMPTEDAEAIAGDLAEEYFGDCLPRLGLRRANRWFNSQALRSAVPLLVSRWRRGELAGLIAGALVTILAPLRLADLLWSFVHSQVPLKADLNWAAGFWVTNLVIAICGAYVLRLASREFRTAVTLAILALACSGATVAMSSGHAPGWYVAALLIVIPAVCLIPHDRKPDGKKEAQ